jgi:hypothetical protein
MAEQAAQHFEPTSTVVRRDAHRGMVWSATPYRVVQDDPGLPVLALWPGVERLAATTSAKARRPGDDVARNEAIHCLAEGAWTLRPRIWRETTRLVLSPPDAYFTVSLFFFDDDDSRWTWYVDFERPYRRTSVGYDTLDLMLDLVIAPDGTSHWKDEDEYDQGRRLGIITDDDHKNVSQAKEQVLSLLERREGPFDESWTTWRRDPGWPRPTLPPNATTSPTRSECANPAGSCLSQAVLWRAPPSMWTVSPEMKPAWRSHMTVSTTSCVWP